MDRSEWFDHDSGVVEAEVERRYKAWLSSMRDPGHMGRIRWARMKLEKRAEICREVIRGMNETALLQRVRGRGPSAVPTPSLVTTLRHEDGPTGYTECARLTGPTGYTGPTGPTGYTGPPGPSVPGSAAQPASPPTPIPN